MVNDISEVYGAQNEFLKAEDIGNQFWTFTIRAYEVKKFNDGTSKIFLTFNEWDKGLPLNVTNARAVAELYGHNPNAWVGRQIMLFTMMVDFQGTKKLAVRLRAPMQMGQPQAPMPMHPAPRPVGALQPGQPAPMPGYAQNSPQRPLQPPQSYAQQSGYSEMNPPPPEEAPPF